MELLIIAGLSGGILLAFLFVVWVNYRQSKRRAQDNEETLAWLGQVFCLRDKETERRRKHVEILAEKKLMPTDSRLTPIVRPAPADNTPTVPFEGMDGSAGEDEYTATLQGL